MQIDFNLDLIRKFTDSLKLGRPLDAGGGGGWDRERILAAAAALYSAAENSQSRLQPPLEAIKAHSTIEHEKSRRAKGQLAQAAQQFGQLSQFAIAGQQGSVPVSVDDNPITQ
jgi:hypothetical protein